MSYETYNEIASIMTKELKKRIEKVKKLPTSAEQTREMFKICDELCRKAIAQKVKREGKTWEKFITNEINQIGKDLKIEYLNKKGKL